MIMLSAWKSGDWCFGFRLGVFQSLIVASLTLNTGPLWS